MIQSGLLLFFLIPGLLSYCAIYGSFNSGGTIAPEPPPANSIEAITLILLAAATVHVTSALGLQLNALFVDILGPIVPWPVDLRDPYAAAFGAIERGATSARGVGGLIGIAMMQGAAAYLLIRLYLRRLARRDRLPAWIYGWATAFASVADNADKAIITYVLTTHDHGDGTFVYVGILYDLRLRPDGSVIRLSLLDGERYLGRLDSPIDEPTLPAPLSTFAFMNMEGAQIRNLVFEVIDLPEPAED